MGLTAAELQFIFGADTRKVDAALDGVGRKVTGTAAVGNQSLGGFWRNQEAGASRFSKVTSGAVSMAKKAFLSLGTVGVGFGAAKFVKDSVQLEAAYGKTMAQIRVATGATTKELGRLDALAIKLGKDTVFSANEASGAMLELSKNGINTATIEAGALNSALTLAAAGSMDLTEAASTMGNALNAFSLKGTQSKQVAAALAGAANASSANVNDLAYGLSQASASAADAGFTLQETTAALAAFANKGIQGSDAGTSLKTFLARLIPTTKQAREAMEGYGLAGYQTEQSLKKLHAMGIKPVSKSMPDVTNAIRAYLIRTGAATEGTMKLEDKTKELLYQTGMMQSAFVKLNGDFQDMDYIAGVLKDRLGDLSDSERAAALNAIFGSDARRAATVLMSEGERGIRQYIKATSDQAQAEKMAKANMEGTAGAIERLKGSWETLKLQFGKFIAPAVADGLEWLTETLDGLPGKITPVARSFREDWLPPIKEVAGFAKDLVGFLNDLPKEVKIGGLAGLAALVGAVKLRGGGGALGTAGRALGLAKPVPVIVMNKGWGAGPGKGVPPVAPIPDKTSPKGPRGGTPKVPTPPVPPVDGSKLSRFLKPLRMLPMLAPSLGGMRETEPLLTDKQAAALDRSEANAKRATNFWLHHNEVIRDGTIPMVDATHEKFKDLFSMQKRVSDNDPKINLFLDGYGDIIAHLRKLEGDLNYVARPRYIRMTLTRDFDTMDGRRVMPGLQERAAGGPVNAGQWYIVGEKGPELFQAGVSGRIHSNRDSAAMLNSGMTPGAAGSGYVRLDPADVQAITRALLQARPVHGDVHVTGDPTVFRREMDADAHAAAYSGMPPTYGRG